MEVPWNDLGAGINDPGPMSYLLHKSQVGNRFESSSRAMRTHLETTSRYGASQIEVREKPASQDSLGLGLPADLQNREVVCKSFLAALGRQEVLQAFGPSSRSLLIQSSL